MIPDLAKLVREADLAALPDLAAAIKGAEVELLLRLHPFDAGASTPETATTEPKTPEVPLTPDEALVLIGGSVSRKWLLRRTKGKRFRHDLSRKVVRFEKAGLLVWIADSTRRRG